MVFSILSYPVFVEGVCDRASIHLTTTAGVRDLLRVFHYTLSWVELAPEFIPGQRSLIGKVCAFTSTATSGLALSDLPPALYSFFHTVSRLKVDSPHQLRNGKYLREIGQLFIDGIAVQNVLAQFPCFLQDANVVLLKNEVIRFFNANYYATCLAMDVFDCVQQLLEIKKQKEIKLHFILIARDVCSIALSILACASWNGKKIIELVVGSRMMLITSSLWVLFKMISVLYPQNRPQGLLKKSNNGTVITSNFGTILITAQNENFGCVKASGLKN